MIEKEIYLHGENRVSNWYKTFVQEYKLCEICPAALICRAKIKPYVVYRLIKVPLHCKLRKKRLTLQWDVQCNMIHKYKVMHILDHRKAGVKEGLNHPPTEQE